MRRDQFEALRQIYDPERPVGPPTDDEVQAFNVAAPIVGEQLANRDKKQLERLKPKEAQAEERTIEDETVTRLSAARQALLEAVDPALTQDESAIRAAARGERSLPAYATEREQLREVLAATDEARRMTEAALDVALVGELQDPSSIVTIVDEALLTEHAPTIRRIGPIAVHRLQALEREDFHREPNRIGSSLATAALATLRPRLEALRRDHPSPSERLAAIEQRRASRKQSIARVFDQVIEVLELDEKSRLRRGTLSRAIPPAPGLGEVVLGRHAR